VLDLGAMAERGSKVGRRGSHSKDSQGAKISRLPKYPSAEAKAMNWYCAHIVMFVELKAAPQKRFPVWENVILFEARNEEDAFEQAERHGRAEAGDDGGTFEWGESPARWVFAGVRKLTECDTPSPGFASGTELTYTEFEVGSRDDVKRLASGKPVKALFHDAYRHVEADSNKDGNETKSARRKRA
jgi:hypothetical protein